MKMRTLLLLKLMLLLSGCITLPDAEERRHSAMQLATAHGWQFRQWKTADFVLAGFSPLNLQTSTLRIYIEGDGLAWITFRQPSKDPTPVKPVALELALKDEQPSVYLARPCQYVMPESSCAMKYWTSHRYAEEVVEATNQVISQIKNNHTAQKLELFGYSGGGAIAALLAARRDDVTRLVTIAGNLDHAYWTRLHQVSPLKVSLNPVDYAEDLSSIPQTHFVGEDDDNIPPQLLQGYQHQLPVAGNSRIKVIPGYDHDCCWLDSWNMLLKQLDSQ